MCYLAAARVLPFPVHFPSANLLSKMRHSLRSSRAPPAEVAVGEENSESVLEQANNRIILPKHRKLHDTGVSFEEYNYYAQKTREEQKSLSKVDKSLRTKRDILFRRNKPVNNDFSPSPEKGESIDNTNRRPSGRFSVSEEEWNDASRLMRTARAGACFYLITTDILGPYGVGFALGTLGWGPGIALYTVFGFMAGYGGWLLYRCFLGLDSYEFPVRNYGDLAFRIYGPIPRHCVNLLQGILLICLLGQVTLQNGQGLSQVGKFRLCYAVCCVIFVVVGFLIGQVRTLKNYGWLASAAVYLNLLVIFITMGVMAHSPPKYVFPPLLFFPSQLTSPVTRSPSLAAREAPLFQKQSPPMLTASILPSFTSATSPTQAV
jgi:Transmembrane amino acid transporter protein